MVEVHIRRNKAVQVEGFSVIGHANCAPRGSDVVCAAISVLTQTVAISVSDYLARPVKVSAGDGNLSLDLLAKPDALTEAVFETMLIGLRDIAKQYPNVLILIDV